MSFMEKDNNKIFEQYFLGNLSQEEEQYLAAWVETDEKNKQYFKQKIKELENNFRISQKSEEWEQLSLKMNRKSKRINLTVIQWSAAAAVVLILFAGWFGYRYYEASDDNWVVVNVPYGKIDSVVLPDQSKVILNSCSTLKYCSDFGNGDRSVELQGEGFFQVTKQDQEKFTVKTGTLKAVVYGTSFNINSYSDTDKTILTLCTGSLKVESEKDAVFIQPGEQIAYTSFDGKMSKSVVDINLFCNWTTGKLCFKSEFFSSIVPKIERKYNVKIDLKSPELANYLFSGEFPVNASLDYILNVLKESAPTPLKIEKKDQTIQIFIDK